MPTPRPYGAGPYGRGPYERNRGSVYDCAGASSIAWAATASPRRALSCAARSSLQWTVVGTLGRTIDLGAARSSLTFDTQALGIQMVFAPQAIASLVFDVLAEGIWSWDEQGRAPCGIGEWTDTDDCGAGVWTPPQPGAPGVWASAAASVATGVWTPPPACSAGTWTGTPLV